MTNQPPSATAEDSLPSRCPTCGGELIHGDCMVCDPPFETAEPPAASVADDPLAGAAAGAAARATAEAVSALAGDFPRATVEAHLRRLPESYVLRTPPAAVDAHIALIERAAGGTAVAHDRADGVDRLTVVSPDRAATVLPLSGTLAAHGVNILGVEAHKRDDGIAIDVLRVRTDDAAGADDPFWARICEDVEGALAGTFEFDAAALAAHTAGSPQGANIPTTVYVDNPEGGEYSRVEVDAADRVGLLYAVARALSDQGLVIDLASAQAEGLSGAVTLYVQRAGGARLEAPEDIDRARAAVIAALAPRE